MKLWKMWKYYMSAACVQLMFLWAYAFMILSMGDIYCELLDSYFAIFGSMAIIAMGSIFIGDKIGRWVIS